MKIKYIENRICTECNKGKNVKEIQVGVISFALCEECREKLHGMLYCDNFEELEE